MLTESDMDRITKVAQTIEEILDLAEQARIPHRETARRIAIIIAESARRAMNGASDE